jgi:uncharacterized protein (TIGR02594 family)
VTPKWLRRAYGELYVSEVSGPGSNPRVLEYHACTTLKATDDDVAWCSAFVCWCFEQDSAEHTRSARARSWLFWGGKLDYPENGCVVVLQRGPGKQPPASVLDAPGHVGLFVGFSDATRILLLGGNQGNAVSIVSYPIHQVLGYRVPAVVQGGE